MEDVNSRLVAFGALEDADRSWPSLPDLAFDLLTGTIVSHSLYAATEQDKTIGKEFVIEVRRGDLVLRDMGYFSLSEFTAIELLEAWWLTRLQLITGVMLADGHILEKYLKSFQGNIIDIDAIVGEQGKKCRLVAMRAAPEVAAARRAERRKKACDCGKNPRPKGLNRKSNEHHLQALVLAGIITHQLGMRIAQRIGKVMGRANLSYEKLYDLLAVRLIKARNLDELAAFDPDRRHVERDKRIRKYPVESGILALT